VASSAFADVTILSSTFENGSYAPWGARGGVTLSIVPDGHNSTSSLSVTNRTANWNGVTTPASGLLEAGQTYTFSAWVKLAAGTTGSTGINFTSEEVHQDGTSNTYQRIGSAVATTADAWVQIGGAYTYPQGLSNANLYIEAAAMGTVQPSFQVDDIVITGPAKTLTVSAVNFDDGTTGTWTKSGGPTLAYVDVAAGNKALSITRAADYEGIQTPTGIFTSGKTYTFSMKARLADAAAGSPSVRFVGKPGYSWIANKAITATDWTTITGSWTAPDVTDPTTLQVYIGSDNLAAPYTILVDDILVTTDAPTDTGPPPGTIAIATNFENGLDGWVGRDGGKGAPTIGLSTVAHGGTGAALVSNRPNQGAGLGHDVTGVLQKGVTYEFNAWVKFADTKPTDEIWLSLANTTNGTTTYGQLAKFTNVTNSGWTQVTARFTAPAFDSALMYFETKYSSTDPIGNTSDFLVDDVTVKVPEKDVIQPLPPLDSTTSFPVGVAIDDRETVGSSAELLTRHFNQITPENHMKPEAWYDANHNFSINPQAVTLMDFAKANNLHLYGHVLVWHSQTPAWFFQNDAGQPLTNSAADQDILRTRLHDHIYNVAKSLSDKYGLFGSATNPLYAFDVVNEVVADTAEYSDGLRRSPWYNVLGESYIDLAFQYANDAFNNLYAVSGQHPVKLFINDYNTEQSGKQARYHDLVSRLIARGVPVQGVGHQFHLSLATPVSSLDAALTAFEDLPVVQAVTEFDVPTGTPVTQAKLIDQGYFVRDVFRIFRAHSAHMFSVTAWGLTDGRSWRSSSGAPLLFDDSHQAKPAYFGAADAQLPARLRSANVFAGDVALDSGATSSLEWSKLPLLPVENVGQFQLRWAPDHLTAYVTANDATKSSTDKVTFVLGGQTYTVARNGTGDVPAVAKERTGGYDIVTQLPLSNAAQGSNLNLDVQVTDGSTTSGWNTPGSTGTLTLVEPLSYLEIPQARAVPTIDGAVDATWVDANVVTTAKQIQGTDGALATVRTLWKDQTLYVLAEVADPIVDTSGSDPWVQDSVEIYVDGGNAKNGSYRPDDAQMRISADNKVSFGTGDEAAQKARLTSATKRTATGYTVEAAISLLAYGGLGTFQGVDFQVNDGTNGARTAIRNWADPTNAGYQSTAHWGVAQLVGPAPIRNVIAPSVQGEPYKNALLSIDRGTWSVPGATFTYEWQVNGKDVLKPGLSTYKVRAEDVGKQITVIVTAHAPGYDAVSVTTAPVTAVDKPTNTPQFLSGLIQEV
jgi:endo-1,4-beta-xylanase